MHIPIPPHSLSTISKSIKAFLVSIFFPTFKTSTRLPVIMSSYTPYSLLWAMLVMLVSMMLLGMGEAQTPSIAAPFTALPTLPAYMHTECYDVSAHGSPGSDSLISTMAKMMDYCGCENPINPSGLAYAGSKSSSLYHFPNAVDAGGL